VFWVGFGLSSGLVWLRKVEIPCKSLAFTSCDSLIRLIILFFLLIGIPVKRKFSLSLAVINT
ncbi:hypothetical protein, partial [Helicobacter bilis]|uniref:hypothetical protein n=1 Tax=Helicobacter bilis TaxID=37372 RepID=UPI0026EE07F7